MCHEHDQLQQALHWGEGTAGWETPGSKNRSSPAGDWAGVTPAAAVP